MPEQSTLQHFKDIPSFALLQRESKNKSGAIEAASNGCNNANGSLVPSLNHHKMMKNNLDGFAGSRSNNASKVAYEVQKSEMASASLKQPSVNEGSILINPLKETYRPQIAGSRQVKIVNSKSKRIGGGTLVKRSS